MQYLEAKYPDVDFQYQSNSGNRQVYFLAPGDSEDLKITVEVEDADAPEFSDNYPEKLAEPAYEEEMRVFFRDYFDEDDFLVLAEVEHLEAGEEPLLVRAQADTLLLIKNDNYELLSIMEAMEAYMEKLRESPWPQSFNGGFTYLDAERFDAVMAAAPNEAFGIRRIYRDFCSRHFSVVTGAENEGLYLDGVQVVIQDGEIVSTLALAAQGA